MNKIKWLRISYWVAAIADFFIAILGLMPKPAGTESYVYPMGLFSAVAFSWGILLIFADRDPLNQRWVLIPTMIVVSLLGFVTLHALILKLVSVNFLIAGAVSSMLIFSLLLFSYLNSK